MLCLYAFCPVSSHLGCLCGINTGIVMRPMVLLQLIIMYYRDCFVRTLQVELSQCCPKTCCIVPKGTLLKIHQPATLRVSSETEPVSRRKRE